MRFSRNLFLVVSLVSIWVTAIILVPYFANVNIAYKIALWLSRFWASSSGYEEFLTMGQQVYNCTISFILGAVAYAIFDSARRLYWVFSLSLAIPAGITWIVAPDSKWILEPFIFSVTIMSGGVCMNLLCTHLRCDRLLAQEVR